MTTAKPKTFLQKIAAAAGEMDNPKKRNDNPGFKGSKFANLSDTMDVVEPVLEKYGLGHTTRFDGTSITYIVFDTETGEREVSSLDLAHVLEGLSGNVWQQIGQAFTYLRRYLAQAFWGLVPEDDDAYSAPSRPAAQRKTQAAKVNAKDDYDVGAQQDQSDADMRSNGGGAL